MYYYYISVISLVSIKSTIKKGVNNHLIPQKNTPMSFNLGIQSQPERLLYHSSNFLSA